MDHCETSSVIFVISDSWMMKRNRDGVSLFTCIGFGR